MDQTISMEKIHLRSNQIKPRYGGLRTMPFIIVNESFEKLASYGLMPNMIFYLMNIYHMKTAAGSSILSLWSALSNFLAIFGAFLSDSYLGQFRVIVIGSFSSLPGMTLLWLTAMIPQLKPPPCDQFNTNCDLATPTQLAILFSSFGLMSIGAGCIRPCSIAFGADQFDNKQNPDDDQILHSFFNWYYASVRLSTVLALTLIVYIQDHMGWAVGFAVPTVLMVFSAFTFLLGSSLYVKVKATNSLFTGFIQVVVVAFKKRNISHPPSNFDQYYQSSCSEYLVPSDNLRLVGYVMQRNVNALIDMKLDKHKNLKEESRFNWQEIADGTLKLNRQECEVAALRQLSQEDVINLFNENIKVGAPQKKTLGVRVYGSKHWCEYTTNNTEAEGVPHHTVINDIYSFRRSQRLYGSLKGGFSNSHRYILIVSYNNPKE